MSAADTVWVGADALLADELRAALDREPCCCRRDGGTATYERPLLVAIGTMNTTPTNNARTAAVIRTELVAAEAAHASAKGSTESYKVKQAKVKQAAARVRVLTSELAGFESSAAADRLNAEIVATYGAPFKKFGFAPSSTLTAAGESRVVLTSAAGIPLTVEQADRMLALLTEFGALAPKPVEATEEEAAPESAK